MTPLGSHSASVLGTHGAAKRRGMSPLSAIGGEAQVVRERSPFGAASAVVGSVVSGQREVRAPYEPRGGQSR